MESAGKALLTAPELVGHSCPLNKLVPQLVVQPPRYHQNDREDERERDELVRDDHPDVNRTKVEECPIFGEKGVIRDPDPVNRDKRERGNADRSHGFFQLGTRADEREKRHPNGIIDDADRKDDVSRRDAFPSIGKDDASAGKDRKGGVIGDAQGTLSGIALEAHQEVLGSEEDEGRRDDDGKNVGDFAPKRD